MDKLYSPPHIVTRKTGNSILFTCLLLFSVLFIANNTKGQCPPAPVVTPATVNMCVGDPPAKLKVISTNPPSQFCSGLLNIPIPDNNHSGLTNTINVTGIPAGCTVTAMSVKINMTHTRAGDMVFVLKAPNGQVINLDYFLGGTGGASATTGFSNTVISSAGITSLSAGTNPYTGTFRADMINAATGMGPTGPTGMVPTVTNWDQLYSVLNGSWTLGCYDGATANVGTLISWCLDITTTCGTTSQGIWSPATGLFYDAAATVPYVAGTAADVVYTYPGPAGIYTYQVVVNSVPAGCTSPPTPVVVTVGQVATITTQPGNQAVCAGNNASFTVAVSGAGPFNYQWQESSNGGATYNNLVNGGIFSGVTTNTLGITAPLLSMSGYKYRVVINGGASCGGAISSAATLTVNPLPTVVINATTLVIQPGQPAIIHSAVTPNPVATYTWYHNSSIVPGATADTLLVDINGLGLGDYQLEVTDISGCTDRSNIVSINDHFAGGVFAYPNPSSGRFEVRTHSVMNTLERRTLVVYNNSGRVLISQQFIQNIPYQKIELDLRGYGKGIYWIEMFNKHNWSLGVSRIVIQ